MGIRVEVRLDQESQSPRWVATATEEGRFLDEVAVYEDSGAAAFKEIAGRLRKLGYSEPDGYLLRVFRMGTTRWEWRQAPDL